MALVNINANTANTPPSGGSRVNHPASGGIVPPSTPIGAMKTADPAPDELTNLNAKAQDQPPAMFREVLVNQTLSILVSKNKPNPLLVGLAGSGKTKIVEEIARRLALADPTIPAQLTGYTIYDMPVSALVSGKGVVGQLEESVQNILDFLANPANKAILFIDEIHQLADTRSSINSSVAQMLKPAMARGDIKVIGATTTQESRKLDDDPAFSRRFAWVTVDELTSAQTEELVKAAIPSYISHYQGKVSIDDSLVGDVVAIADEWSKSDQHRPDTALTLLDRTMASTVVEFERLRADPRLSQHLPPSIPITRKKLLGVALSLLTGNSEEESFTMDELKSAMSAIVGQNEASEQIVDLIAKRSMGLFSNQTPLTMLFHGASGVGKTQMAKVLAEVVTGDKPIVLNLTEFHNASSINRIIGAPAGYVGSDSNRELPFDSLATNPYRVILLDEFEKGDEAVQRLFMKAFDEGSIQTSMGRDVDFSKAIIIATTNAGQARSSIGFGETPRRTKKQVIENLASSFDRELLGRFSRIIEFNELCAADFEQVIRLIYASELERLRNSSPKVAANLPEAVDDDSMKELVAEFYVKELGARPAKDAVRSFIMANA